MASAAPSSSPSIDWSKVRVLLTGGAGFFGRAIASCLAGRGVAESSVFVPRRREYDLRVPEVCRAVVDAAFPRGWAGVPVIIHAAGRSGGLGAVRAEPAAFFHDNLAMAPGMVEAARASGFIERGGLFVQIGHMSSYPADAPQPYSEEWLGRGRPDAEIAPYGLAKLAALELLSAYRAEHGLAGVCLIPANLYGPGDTSDPARSHAAGALMQRFSAAAARGDAEVVCWGSGKPTRDFLYLEDAAEGVVRAVEVMGIGNAMEDSPRLRAATDGGIRAANDGDSGVMAINLSTGREVSIRELAETIASAVGYRGRIVWDPTRPEGQPRRCLDPRRAERVLGWRAMVSLEEGIGRTVVRGSGSGGG